jgi:phosphate acetyltransferase
MESFAGLKSKAIRRPRRIVFPEGESEWICQAAHYLKTHGFADPIVLNVSPAQREKLREANVDMVDIASDEKRADYIRGYCQSREMPEALGERLMGQELYFACMMLKTGRADGMVAGINCPTEEVIMGSQMILGLQDGIEALSSFSLLDIPDYQGKYGSLIVFADPSTQPDPNPVELADIACMTAATMQKMLGWEPKVALLSFSTKGSASHPLVQKVVDAVEELGKRNCQFDFDGELQLDAAIDLRVGGKKTNGKSTVAGQANILIFPDLNACNIGLKLVEQFAHAKMYGPVLQGVRYPVSDLSRGSSVEDIVGTALLISSLC